MYDAVNAAWMPHENIGDFGSTRPLLTSDYAQANFRVPHDFTSITSAVIVVIPIATMAGCDIDIFSDYGAVTEAYTTHSESDTFLTYNLTANTITEIDISPILSALAADDYVGIKILNNVPLAAQGLNVLGIYFRYS